jgi:hypothetical protein
MGLMIIRKHIRKAKAQSTGRNFSIFGISERSIPNNITAGINVGRRCEESDLIIA